MKNGDRTKNKKVVYYPSREIRGAKKSKQHFFFSYLIIGSFLFILICLAIYFYYPGDQRNNFADVEKNTVNKSQVKIISAPLPESSLKSDLKTLETSEIEATSSSDEKNEPVRSQTDSYQVSSGDTLSSIADRFGISVSDLKKYNNLENDLLIMGQELSLVQLNNIDNKMLNVTYIVQIGDTLENIARNNGSSLEEIRVANALNSSEIFPGQNIIVPKSNEMDSASKESANVAQRVFHTVQKNENLYRIAMKYGTTVESIKELNRTDSSDIQVGLTIQVK